MAGVGIQGAEKLSILATALRQAGDRDLQKELYSGLNRAAQPLKQIAIDSAMSSLPKGGGRGRRGSRLKKTGTVDIGGKTFVRRARVRTSTMKTGDSVAARVAGASFTVKRSGGARNPSIRFEGKSRGGKKIALKQLDAGQLRHPVFGNRGVWVSQAVTPGWWTRALTAPGVVEGIRKEMIQAMDNVAIKIASKG